MYPVHVRVSSVYTRVYLVHVRVHLVHMRVHSVHTSVHLVHTNQGQTQQLWDWDNTSSYLTVTLTRSKLGYLSVFKRRLFVFSDQIEITHTTPVSCNSRHNPTLNHVLYVGVYHVCVPL